MMDYFLAGDDQPLINQPTAQAAGQPEPWNLVRNNEKYQLHVC